MNKNDNINIPLEITDKLQNKFQKYKKKRFEEESFYIDSQSIKDLLVNMYICMISKINACLVGKTGIGKTHLARTFSKIFRGENEYNITNILFIFNSESTLENLYGTFAFEGGNTIIVEGPLYKTMKEGLIFIADEFILVEESIIQSLTNIL